MNINFHVSLPTMQADSTRIRPLGQPGNGKTSLEILNDAKTPIASLIYDNYDLPELVADLYLRSNSPFGDRVYLMFNSDSLTLQVVMNVHVAQHTARKLDLHMMAERDKDWYRAESGCAVDAGAAW